VTAPTGGIGILSVVVWPTHVGAVKSNGEEPMFDLDYQRGQITWGMDDTGQLSGHANIAVPAGEWAWIIYSNDQYTPGFVHAQKLAQPLILSSAGMITMEQITEGDIRPLLPDPVLHD
jgi:hypothetical protein